ncbi:MAG: amidase [Actinobacteria bacterium]|nr:MAG: amidase [Actinomycetota bacterium]
MNRRALLAASLVLACCFPAGQKVAGAAGSGIDCLATTGGVDLLTATVPQLARALATGRFTSRGLTKAYLRRIRAFDHGTVKINAVRRLTSDALKQADSSDARRRRHRTLGPLDGIPVILKDNIGTRDAPTTAGSIALAGNVPKREATLVSRLRAAGAVILAKTNLSEFANWVDPSMPNGYSSLGGQVVNPYTEGDPSGSSSGSGAGEALGYAAVAVGTETSGSILSPSDAESLVGIKPTVGLVSRRGVIPLAQSFDTAGPMARNVTDAASLLQAMAGRDPSDAPFDEAPGGPPVRPDYLSALRPGALRGTQLGYSPADVNSLPADQATVFNRALADLRAAGAVLVTTNTLSNTSLAGLTELSEIPNEFKFGVNHYLANDAGPGLPVKNLTDIVIYNQQHPQQMKYGQRFIIASDATPGIYGEPTALASRTVTIESSRYAIDSVLSAHQLDAYLTPGAFYANIGAAAGYPTVIVPMGFVGSGARAPMGIGFLGSAWTERSLIALAFDYERVSHRRQQPTAVNHRLLSSVC